MKGTHNVPQKGQRDMGQRERKRGGPQGDRVLFLGGGLGTVAVVAKANTKHKTEGKGKRYIALSRKGHRQKQTPDIDQGPAREPICRVGRKKKSEREGVQGGDGKILPFEMHSGEK